MIGTRTVKAAARSGPLPRTLALLLVIAAFALGLGLAQWPAETGAVFVLSFMVLAILLSPTAALVLFLIFVIVQDPLQILLGGDATPTGLAIKRADEPLLLVLGGLCILLDSRVHRLIRQRWFGVSAVGVYAAMVLSTLLHPVNWLAAILDLAMLSKPFLFLVIGVSLTSNNLMGDRTRDLILTVAVVILSFGFLFALFPFLQDFYLRDVRGPDLRMGLDSAQGIFLGPGAYSWFGAATFALAYAAYLVFRRRWYLLVALFAATAVVLSWRRKSMIAVVFILLTSMLVAKARNARARVVLVIGIAVIAAASVLSPYLDSLWRVTQAEYVSSDPMHSARSALHYTGLVIAMKNFPLGTGLGTYGSFASRLFYSDVYYEYGLSSIYGLGPANPEYLTDTYWPMVIAEGGFIAIACFVTLFWGLIRACWRATQSTLCARSDTALGLTALFLIVGSLAESTASHIYGSSFHSAIALVPAGMLLGRVFLRENDNRGAGDPLRSASAIHSSEDPS